MDVEGTAYIGHVTFKFTKDVDRVNQRSLPSWLNDVKSMGPVEGLEFLRQKFQKRIYANRIKRAFFKKSEVHGGRVNDVYRNDIVQIAILLGRRRRIQIFYSKKMDFLTRCHRTKQHIESLHCEHNFMYIANC